MSDEQKSTQDDQQAGPADDLQQPQNEPETFDKDYVKKLREESAKYRTQAKENADAAKRLAEMEEAQKTESQRQAEALEAANSRLAEYERKEQVAGWVAQVSDDYSVPASALRGSTLEEIEAHAEDLKSFMKAPDGNAGEIRNRQGYVPSAGTGGERPPRPTYDEIKQRAYEEARNR